MIALTCGNARQAEIEKKSIEQGLSWPGFALLPLENIQVRQESGGGELESWGLCYEKDEWKNISSYFSLHLLHCQPYRQWVRFTSLAELFSPCSPFHIGLLITCFCFCLLHSCIEWKWYEILHKLENPHSLTTTQPRNCIRGKGKNIKQTTLENELCVRMLVDGFHDDSGGEQWTAKLACTYTVHTRYSYIIKRIGCLLLLFSFPLLHAYYLK